MKKIKNVWVKIGILIFAVMAFCCSGVRYTVDAEEIKEYDAELVGVKEFYNMGINSTMKGGSAGTIYPGEKFIVLDVIDTSSGRRYYVHAVNANKKGYVSEKYIKLVETPGSENKVVTEVGKKVNYNKANDVYHDVKTVVTYSDGKVSEIPACEKHSFKNGKCEKCSAVQVADKAGNYVAKNKMTVYEKTESASKKVKTLAKGTKVVITEVKVNKYNNYWGTLADGSGYVWMGNLKKDGTSESHSTIQYDAELIGIKEFYNMGMTSSMTGASAGTIYPGEKFIILGKENTSSGIKYYVQALNANKKGYISEKYVKLVEAGLIDIKEYYKTSCDESHKKCTTKTYADGIEKTSYVVEKHTFKDGKCSLCGAKKVSKVKGEYITKTNVQVYYGTISASTKVKKIKKGETIQISEVTTNIYGNYWGKLADGSGNVWMGNLELVEPLEDVQRRAIVEIALWEFEKYGCRNEYVSEGNKPLSEPIKYNYGWTKKAGKSSSAWCADFVNWCANQADIPMSIFPHEIDGKTKGDDGNGYTEYGRYYMGKSLAYVPHLYEYMIENCNAKYYATKSNEVKNGEYIPKPGDLIIYANNNSECQHIGMVVDFEPETKYVITIEGNTSYKGNTVTGSGAKEYKKYNDSCIAEKRRIYNQYLISNDNPATTANESWYLQGYLVPDYGSDK